MPAAVKDMGDPAPASGAGGGGGGGADPGTGYGANSGLWTDACEVRPEVDWEITGGVPKNVEVKASGDFPQTVALAGGGALAGAPLTRPEVGDGTTISVAGYEPDNTPPSPDNICDPDNPEFTFHTLTDAVLTTNFVDDADCSPCGPLSFRNADPRTIGGILTGKHGTRYVVVGYQDNTYCAKFFSERRAEILLTDESGTRGLRCGFALRIQSEWIKFSFSSDPQTRVSMPGYTETFPLSGLKVPAELKWTVEGNYYIKTSCNLANSHAEADVANLPLKGIEIFTKPCTDAVPMTPVSATINSEWVDQHQDVYTERTVNDSCLIGKICSETAPGVTPSIITFAVRSCWLLGKKTFNWQIPGPNTYSYYVLNEGGIETELAKHEADFWVQLTNYSQPEANWIKYPFFGPVNLGLKKREGTIELQLLGNKNYPVLRWVDPFVNRVLKVAGESGTTVYEVNDLDV